MQNILMVTLGILALPYFTLGSVISFDVDRDGHVYTYSGLGIVTNSGSYWNSLVVPQMTVGVVTIDDALDSYGNSTGVDILMSRNNGGELRVYDESFTGNPNPTDLMRDYTYFSGWAVTLSGLEAGTYNLYCFGHGNGIGQTTTFTLDAANGGASAGTTDNLTDFRDIFQENAEGNTYAKLPATVDASGTLVFSGFTYLNGFQIEAVPEPTTISLMSVFSCCLIYIRRRLRT